MDYSTDDVDSLSLLQISPVSKELSLEDQTENHGTESICSENPNEIPLDNGKAEANENEASSSIVPFPLEIDQDETENNALLVSIAERVHGNHATKHPTSNNHTDEKGETIVKVEKFFRQQTSDCNKRNARGLSPLSISSSQCFLKGMMLLIQSGADVNLADVHGRTPLHLAAEKVDSNEHHECVEYLLVNGARVDIQDCIDKRTPLHIASKRGCVRCINRLLQYKARTDITDSEGNTALHVATEMRHLGCMEALSPSVSYDADADDESHSSVDIVSSSLLVDCNRLLSKAKVSDVHQESFYQSPRQQFSDNELRRQFEFEPSPLPSYSSINNDRGYLSAKSDSNLPWRKKKFYLKENTSDRIKEERESLLDSMSTSTTICTNQTDNDAIEEELAKDLKLVSNDLLSTVLNIILRALSYLIRYLLMQSNNVEVPRREADVNESRATNKLFAEPPNHVKEAMERFKLMYNDD